MWAPAKADKWPAKTALLTLAGHLSVVGTTRQTGPMDEGKIAASDKYHYLAVVHEQT